MICFGKLSFILTRPQQWTNTFKMGVFAARPSFMRTSLGHFGILDSPKIHCPQEILLSFSPKMQIYILKKDQIVTNNENSHHFHPTHYYHSDIILQWTVNKFISIPQCKLRQQHSNSETHKITAPAPVRSLPLKTKPPLPVSQTISKNATRKRWVN